MAQPRASLHRWSDPQFDTILRQWLSGANRQMLAEIDAVNAELPFTASYDPPQAPRPQP
jgi:predicted N-acyltransferase